MTTETTNTQSKSFANVVREKLAKHPRLKKLAQEKLDPVLEYFTTWAAIGAYGANGLARDFELELDDANALADVANSEAAAAPAMTVNLQADVAAATTETKDGNGENPWDYIDLKEDVLMRAYAGSRLAPEYIKLLPDVGKLHAMVALDRTGARAAIIKVGQLLDNGQSAIEVPDEIGDVIFDWWRMVVNRHPDIALPEERIRLMGNIETLVPEELDQMMQAAGRFGTASNTLKALGEGASFDIASVQWTLTDLALQMPDVMIDSAKTLRRGNMRQYYRLMMRENEEFIFPILESPSWQRMTGITVDEDPKNSVGKALEAAGFPVAQAAFNWAAEVQKIWAFMPTMPVDDDQMELWILSLGKRSRRAMAAAANVNRIIKRMEQQGATLVGNANEAVFRSAPEHVRVVAAPPAPRGLRVFGFNISFSASISIANH